MIPPGLEGLPREALLELCKVYARNWQTLDGLWFRNVEAEYGLEAACRLDLKNWEEQAVLEAKRLREVLMLNKGGIGSVLTALSFMSWQVTSPRFEIDHEDDERVVFHWARCAVQESRRKQRKPVFPCRPMKLALLSGVAGVIEPRALVRCLAAPPDPVKDGCWCQWEITVASRK